MFKVISSVFVLVFLMGCAATDDIKVVAKTSQSNKVLAPVLDWRSDVFKLVEVPQVQDIFTLSEDKQQHFLDYFHNPNNQTVEEHKRLYSYLENMFDGFSYKGDTYNANMSSTEQSGNCLSLAILTKAYASLVNIETHYFKVNSAPIYQRQNGVMTISSHVQTHIYAPKRKTKKGVINLFRAKIIIDYFPTSENVVGSVLTEADFISMYYQNLAAQAIVEKKYDLAYSLLAAAINLSSNNVGTLNSLAVLYKKSGNLALAHSIYRFALDHTKGSVSLLSNYILFLEQKGLRQEALLLQDRYNQLDDKNPYVWYDLANQAFNNQSYSIALRFYEKSIQVAPYLHESYFGQAKTYFHLGKKHKAKRAMKKAAELAFKPSDEKLYLAKLNSLTQNNSE